MTRVQEIEKKIVGVERWIGNCKSNSSVAGRWALSRKPRVRPGVTCSTYRPSYRKREIKRQTGDIQFRWKIEKSLIKQLTRAPDEATYRTAQMVKQKIFFAS